MSLVRSCLECACIGVNNIVCVGSREYFVVLTICNIHSDSVIKMSVSIYLRQDTISKSNNTLDLTFCAADMGTSRSVPINHFKSYKATIFDLL